MVNKEDLIKDFETLIEKLLKLTSNIQLKKELNKIMENINTDLAMISSIYKIGNLSLTKEEIDNLTKRLESHQKELHKLAEKMKGG